MAREALAVTVGARAWSGPTDTGDDFVPHVLSVAGQQLVAHEGGGVCGLPVWLLRQTTVVI